MRSSISVGSGSAGSIARLYSISTRSPSDSSPKGRNEPPQENLGDPQYGGAFRHVGGDQRQVGVALIEASGREQLDRIDGLPVPLDRGPLKSGTVKNSATRSPLGYSTHVRGGIGGSSHSCVGRGGLQLWVYGSGGDGKCP